MVILCHVLAEKRGLMLGLTFSHEMISHDEGLHAESACLMYGMLQHRLPDDVVHDIIRSAVEVEGRFICQALSCDLIGMNSELLTRYVEFVVDRSWRLWATQSHMGGELEA